MIANSVICKSFYMNLTAYPSPFVVSSASTGGIGLRI
jgi:hypothetical protein